LRPTATRDRLTSGIYRTIEPDNPLGMLQEALEGADGAEPLEKRVRVEGVKTGRVTALALPDQVRQALAAGILSETEAATLQEHDRRVMAIVSVDDFTDEEIAVRPPSEDTVMNSAPPTDIVPARQSGEASPA